MEGDVHARYRHAFAPAFTTEAVRAAHGVIARTSRRQLSTMAQSAGSTGVHPEPYLLEVPFVALLHTVLGVPPEHPRLPALRAGFEAITVPFEVHLPTPPSIARGYADLVAITHELAEVAADSAVPSVLRSLARQDAAHARDATIAGNLVLMVKEGASWCEGCCDGYSRHSPLTLHTHGPCVPQPATPGSLKRCRLPSFEKPSACTRAAISTGRRVTMSRSGLSRAEGLAHPVCIGEAHEDPRHFPDPQHFDPSRFMGSLPGPDRYCPFGAGPHACLGEDLTLAIAGGFAREAALGFDLHTVSDGPVWRINRHWGLWRPSPEFRLSLTPQAAGTHA
jgi:cytochrome P450